MKKQLLFILLTAPSFICTNTAHAMEMASSTAPAGKAAAPAQTWQEQLLAAARCKNFTRVCEILAPIATSSLSEKDANTLISAACEGGEEIMNFILPLVKERNSLGSQLFAAVGAHNEPEVEKLVSQGAPLDYKHDPHGHRSLFIHAALHGCTPVIEASVKNHSVRAALMRAMLIYADIKHSDDADFPPDTMCNALNPVCMLQDSGWCSIPPCAYPDIHELDEALRYAVMKGCLDITEILINHGADITTLDLQSEAVKCLFFEAVKTNKVWLCAALLKHGIDPNIVESNTTQMLPYEDTPLVCAAEKGYEDLVNILLAHGANPNGYQPADDKIAHHWLHHYHTPLAHAIANQKHSIIKILLAHGATVDDRTLQGNAIVAPLNYYYRQDNLDPEYQEIRKLVLARAEESSRQTAK